MRSLALGLCAAALALGVATPAVAAPPVDPITSYVVSTAPETLPEGIDVTPDGRIYVGTIGGGVHAGEVGAPTLSSLGTRPFTFGTHVDQRGRIWVAAWDSVLVLDAAGNVLTTLPLPEADVAAGAAANDLVITHDAVYVTDMNTGHVYRIALHGNEIGAVEPFLAAGDLGLDPAMVGWNGIVATPDGKTLLVSALGLGELYRVDVRTGQVTQVATDAPFGPDGMELQGHTLYGVLNTDLAPSPGVYVLELSQDYASGTVVASTTGDMFDYPTTLALHRGSVYVVNGQFDAWPGTPPYTITVIPDPCSTTKAC